MDSLFAVPYFPSDMLRQINIEPYISADEIADLCSAAQSLERLGCSIEVMSSINDSSRQFHSVKSCYVGLSSLSVRATTGNF
jgi:hypothetical protein